MSEEILSGPVDITDRVHALGWQTTGLTVRAYTVADEDSLPEDSECYTPTQLAAWSQGEWRYVGVVVTVTGAHGFEWGRCSLFSVECGWWTDTNENDTVTSARAIDPLTDPDHPLPDIIVEAMNDVAKRIATYTLPKITEPTQ